MKHKIKFEWQNCPFLFRSDSKMTDDDVTDQFKEGYIEELIERTKCHYETQHQLKIHGKKYRVEIVISEGGSNMIRFMKHDSYASIYLGESVLLDEDDRVIKYKTTEELNKIIKSYNYDKTYRINKHLVYANQQCSICHEKKPHYMLIALNKCKHEFCRDCLDTIESMDTKHHKCALCRAQWVTWDDYANNSDTE